MPFPLATRACPPLIDRVAAPLQAGLERPVIGGSLGRARSALDLPLVRLLLGLLLIPADAAEQGARCSADGSALAGVAADRPSHSANRGAARRSRQDTGLLASGWGA